MERDCLVIGDLHGHLDRLEALLIQEGLYDQCPDCKGVGITYLPEDEDEMGGDCHHCQGFGNRRTDKPVDVVLLGDIGHFGTTGSPTGDLLTWQFATRVANVILWGNHDRAMVDDFHAFSDFHRYPMEAFDYFDIARQEGKLVLAYAAHGYLMTHAGLHYAFRDQKNVPDEVKESPYAFADWINQVERIEAEATSEQKGVRDSIGVKRGGRQHAGGILWRDIGEKLYDGFPQVFGHSADNQHAVRYVSSKFHTRSEKDYDLWASIHGVGEPSFCVDIGGKGDKPGDNCLAGVYLPSKKIVKVDLWSTR